MVNWSLNYEDENSVSVNASFGDADTSTKSPRRRVSRRRSSTRRLDGQTRIQKVVNGQVMNLRVRRVVRS